MDIFNSAENMKEFLTDENKEDLVAIIEDFQRGDFSDVLSKTKQFREKHDVNEDLARSLLLFDATCYSQIGESKNAADAVMRLYQDSNDKSIDDLILYGSIAYMCDYKLARRILSDAVNQIENEKPFDEMKAARTYLLLGQTEDKLEKFVRAIKYYSRSLTSYERAKEQDKQTILFLHFKLGELHSMIREEDVAINYLEKTIELAGVEDNQEVKINCLVSIAKMYGNKEEYEKAFACLEEAIPMLEGSTLANKRVHAEAYTEMAYNYFAQSQYDKAVSNYDKAIALHQNLPNYSARELGMIYMQYAYCLDQKEQPDKLQAGLIYEKAIEELEKTNDHQLLEDALADTIEFFDRAKNKNKKRFYENKFVKVTNEKAHSL
jgi:tetratricopeptide (TPR) repeat protein